MSLLVVIIDCSPSLVVNEDQFLGWLDSIITFCNSHLMLDEKNELTVIGSYTTANKIICCTKAGIKPSSAKPIHAGQFEKFTFISNAIRKGISSLVTGSQPLISSDCLLAAALGSALCKINSIKGLNPRILFLSCSMRAGGYASQYMNLMNSFFAAQKVAVPIDACIYTKVDLNVSPIIQQGCDLTGGYFLSLPQLSRNLEYLLWIFLPDQSLRESLLLPEKKKAAHQAACFCHRTIIDVGYVCSVCLSIFCTYSPICTTCQSHFKMDVPKKVLNKVSSSIKLT